MSGTQQTTENLPGGKAAQNDAGGQPDNSLEARARRMGWHPEAEYRGKAAWVDAAEFVRISEETMPVLRENLRKQDAKMASLERSTQAARAEVAAMAAQVSESRQATLEMHNMWTKAEERGFKRAMTALEARVDAAIEAGDVEAAKAARAELKTVTEEATTRAVEAAKAPKTEEKKQPDAGKVQPDPDAAAWVSAPEQDWYRNNIDAKALAEGYFTKIRNAPGGAARSMVDVLDAVRKHVAKKLPEYFADDDPDVTPPATRENVEERTDERPEPRRSASVASPRSPAPRPRGNGQSFADIPAADQATYQRLKAELPPHAQKTFTPEKYAKDYFEG